jgi:hypothetical protein
MDFEKKAKLGLIEWIAIAISGLLIVFSFFAPSIFTNPSSNDLDFTQTGPIGDTVSGLMNPFIGIAGVILTFLAFYIQYKANNQQRSLFRQELDFNKFENQFYEMLKLHKENVNEITLDLVYDSYVGSQLITTSVQIKGREVFEYFLEEILIIYYVIKKNFLSMSNEERLKIAYSIFFHGISVYKKLSVETDEKKDFREKVLKGLEYINNGNRQVGNRGNKYKFNKYVYEKSDYPSVKNLSYDLFQGHSAKLAHYYRHLYQTVKFIANQNEKFISYEEKRNYLRILRSQLSNQEQGMLFYNWKSEYGKSWENEENKFFTDYRIIHNLYDGLLIPDFKLKDYFDIESESIRKEKNRETDNLFESQDW